MTIDKTGFARRHAMRTAGPNRQRGVVMWVALGVLIVMTLAGLAMLRQMGGGLSIAGNLAFKQSATSLSDLGTESARVWVKVPGQPLATSLPGSSYYATWDNLNAASADPTAWPAWATAPGTTDAATGNTVQWVIHRLCDQEGVDANGPLQHCSASGSRGASRGVPAGFPGNIVSPFFRITTKVTGPRNTVSYVQVLLN